MVPGRGVSARGCSTIEGPQERVLERRAGRGEVPDLRAGLPRRLEEQPRVGGAGDPHALVLGAHLAPGAGEGVDERRRLDLEAQLEVSGGSVAAQRVEGPGELQLALLHDDDVVTD